MNTCPFGCAECNPSIIDTQIPFVCCLNFGQVSVILVLQKLLDTHSLNLLPSCNQEWTKLTYRNGSRWSFDFELEMPDMRNNLRQDLIYSRCAPVWFYWVFLAKHQLDGLVPLLYKEMCILKSTHP